MPETPSIIGKSLQHYRVVEKLGAGGMGEVYRAADSKLGRDVAVKILPESFAGDPERLARFEREARVLASLNHPNIAAIYGLEHSDNTHYLVLELVPGTTLAGRLPVEEALEVCRQIAEAVESAHESDVIHRDLKPANVKLTPQGKVKVLDFGLAKALEGGVVTDLTESPTMSVAGTRGGVVLGTAAYMSPEQARGRPLDKRTDIWSFGCVLYELLAGRKAFAGDTVSDTVASILRNDPDWSALPAETPTRVRSLLRRCLHKDAQKRLRDIGDARIDLEEALAELKSPQARATAQAVEAGAATAGSKGMWWAATGVLAIAAAAGAWWLRGQWVAPSGPAQDVRVHRLTDFVGLEIVPALSPDGKSVAFVADVDGQGNIWVRLLAGGSPLQLTHDAGRHMYPRWSRDSASLLYFTAAETPEGLGTLWEIAALGGAPRRIVTSITGGDISYDDKRICFLRFEKGQLELATADRNGTSVQVVTRLEPGFNYSNLRWSPDGQWIAFQRGGSLNYDIFMVASTGGEVRPVTNDHTMLGGFTWLPDSSGVVYSTARGSTILYLQTYNLWTVSREGKGLRQLTFGETSYSFPDMGVNGQIVASRRRLQSDIWRFPVDGDPAENVRRGMHITGQTGHVLTPSLSPGDKEVVYLSDSGGHGNLWVGSMDGKQARQITTEKDPELAVGVPVWSPDGKYIAYVTRRPGTWNVDLWVIHPDGSSPREVAEESGWAAWSPDGRWLYHGTRAPQSGVWGLRKVPAEGGQSVTLQTDNAYAPSVATDGTLYYVKPSLDATGFADLEIRKAKPEDGRSQLLARISGARIPPWQLIHPVLSPDGKWLALPLSDGFTSNLWAVPTAGGPWRQLTQFAPRRTLIARRVSWSADGRSVVAAVADADNDIVLLEGLKTK